VSITPGRLWFGLLGAPAAWAVTEFLGYALVARSCEAGRNGLNAYGVGNPPVAVGVLVLLMLAIAAAAAWTAGGSLHRLGGWPGIAARPRPEGDRPAEWGRARFMALAGVMTGALFGLGIILIGLPPFLVRACSEAR
jgi:hypothetical protein